VKVKLSLCLAKYHAVKVYGVVEVQLRVFLTSGLDREELSASRPYRFNPGTYQYLGTGTGCGIALGYMLVDRGFESRQRLGIFLFTTAVFRPALRPTEPPIQ
jgi:hypothetical protein